MAPAAIFLVSLSAGQTPLSLAECESGGGFAFCRETLEVYVQYDARYVAAFDLKDWKQRWVTDLGSGAITSDLAVAGPVVAFGSGPSELWTLQRASGAKSWKRDVRTREVAGVGSYVVAQTDRREGIIALDSVTGATVWRHAARPRTDPLFLDLLASSGSSVLTSLFSIDVAAGSITARWEPNGGAARVGVFWEYGQVVGFEPAQLIAYKQNATIAWRLQLPTDGLIAGKVSRLISVPDGVVAVVSGRLPGAVARVIRVTSSGQLKWIREVTNDGAIAGHVGPIGLGGEAVFIATVAKAGGPTISAFHLETGSPLWRTSTIVALTSERGFTIGGDKTYLMGEQGGLPVLLKVDALTGRIDAEFKFR